MQNIMVRRGVPPEIFVRPGKNYSSENIVIYEPYSRLTSLTANFDGSSFGGGMLVGLTYIFIPIFFALELIDDREVIFYSYTTSITLIILG